MRCVITRVLPEPAPARINNGPSTCATASRCAGFNDESAFMEIRKDAERRQQNITCRICVLETDATVAESAMLWLLAKKIQVNRSVRCGTRGHISNPYARFRARGA